MSKAIINMYATDAGRDALARMSETQKKRLAKISKECKKNPELASKRTAAYTAAGKVAWETIKNDPSSLSEFRDKISTKMVSRFANATPKQRAVWTAQQRLGQQLRKVPESKRAKLKAKIYSALEATRLRSKDKIYAMVDEMLMPHLRVA